MALGVVTLPDDSANTGKNVRNTSLTEGGKTVYGQVVSLGDPNTASSFASVLGTAPVGNELALAIRSIGANSPGLNTIVPLTAFTASDAGTTGQPVGDGLPLSGTVTAGSFVGVTIPDGYSAWTLLLKGMTAGAIIYAEVSNNSTNYMDGDWIPVKSNRAGVTYNLEQMNYVFSGNGYYRGNAAGFNKLRFRLFNTTTYPSAQIYLSQGTGAVYLNSGIPAGTQPIGKVIPTDGAGNAFPIIAAAYVPATATDTALTVAVRDPVLLTTPYTAPTDITVVNANLYSGIPTAGSFVSIALQGCNTLGIQATGTFNETLVLQGTVDGLNWVSLLSPAVLLNVNTGAYTSYIVNTAGLWQADVGGFTAARISCTAFSSGKATVSLRASSSASMVALDAPIPAGTALIGAFNLSQINGVALTAAAALGNAQANPTPMPVGAFGKAFNGATWDQVYNNWNTTAADTGTKTASYVGATQTNYNARGVAVTLNIGTVSGTSPTLVGQLQFSPDGGTTWVNIPGAATASITATGVYTLMVYPGIAAVANSMVNAPLARTWRVNYTLGGTTPSFVVTSVLIAYML